MTHSLSPESPAETRAPHGGESPGAADPVTDPAGMPLDRSRFSRWLASFGLGESTLPILRPLKSARRHGSP